MASEQEAGDLFGEEQARDTLEKAPEFSREELRRMGETILSVELKATK